mgnify:CR=1 FL=1
MNWDPQFETAISDLEVENTEVDGHMWHFKYPLAGGETYTYVEKDEDGNITLEEERDYISIATTRPETMLGDGAVAVHPSDERYAPIIGKLCEIPVGPKEHRRLIPIITDEYPDKDFGSGAVKITGAHDFNDYQVAKRNKIPLYRLMDVRADMRNDGAPYAECAAQAKAIVENGDLPDETTVDAINLVPDEYRGLDRFEAREKVIADINAEGLAVMTTRTVTDEEGNESEEAVAYVENKKIMQPFGDRSGVVIEPMLTDQWFADAKTLAEPALASVKEGRTNFVPKTWENTYFNWMENIEPWCISRQLWWGHQIPAWYDSDGNIYVARSEREAQQKAGADVVLTRDPDVLDTWFSSALWPFSTLGWPDETPELDTYYQTDVLVTGFDIIFFWVARMMMMSLHFMKDENDTPVEPFHTVYVHALVRDKHGAKMSKSKGNVIDPLDLIEEYGADALRFTLAVMAAQGRDVKLDPARIAGYRNFGTKLWNASRFAEMNEAALVDGFDPKACKDPFNRWILSELTTTIESVSKNIETYRFNEAAGDLYKFVWNQFCDWYVELSKPVLSGDDAAAKAETQACMAYTLSAIYRLLHPFMPYMTEELLENLRDDANTMTCLSPWPEAALSDETAAADVNWLTGAIGDIRSTRAEMNIAPKVEIPIVVVGTGDETKRRLTKLSTALSRMTRAPSVELADSVPTGAVQIVIGEATFCLPVADIIDLKAEAARIAGELKKNEAEIKRLEGKLGNEKFVANAPESVITENREKLTDYQSVKEKLLEAQARLSSI